MRTSVVRHAAGAVALVVGVAAVYGLIGAFDADGDTIPVVADRPDEADDPAEVPDAEDPDTVQPGDGGKGAEEQTGDAGETGDSEQADDADPGDADADPGDADEADDGDDDATDEADEEEDRAPDIDPATITVQVLDGYQADGGAAADGVATQLDDAGYDIVARNPALRYDVTTVLWTAGHEDQGRQIADEIGAAEVREQPGNLSDAVAVHVVVGADRG